MMQPDASQGLWELAEIAAAVGGVPGGAARLARPISGVTFDSREVKPGELFIALSGAQADGHAYVHAAYERGAVVAIVSDPQVAARLDQPHILVADTSAALNALALVAVARAAEATRIGVTGSVGKTGVKEALKACFLRMNKGGVHASVKSYNNHTGVPLSLARMPRTTRFGVFEMGMNHAGELTELTRLVQPHVAVVTTVASAHRAYFASEEAIADAKAEIFQGLTKGGVAVLNRDNRHYHRLRMAAEAAGAARTVSFGVDNGKADVRPLVVSVGPLGTAMTARVLGETLTFKVGLPGAHWALNALGVLAAVKVAGGDLALAGLALADLSPLDGRGRVRPVCLPDGGSVQLIDESYNANPASMAAALAVLGGVLPAGRGRRIAVLGEMRELGDEADAEHQALAPLLHAAGVTPVILVGGGAMHALAEALAPHVTVIMAADAAAALEALRDLMRAEDVVLLKGSNSVGLGGLVAALAAD